MTLNNDTAASLMSQMGNPTRLRIVRELVRAGRVGMPVGEIQRRLKVPHSTLSHHIRLLCGVGLVQQVREGTVLRCFVDYSKIDGIVQFLTKECCVMEKTRAIS
jgi:DNA-binding transcriptional ArsR family regulator